MNQLGGVSVILLVLSVLCFHVRAQTSAPSSGDAVSNFQPSLAVVIGILGVMFLLTFFLLMYAKFGHRRHGGASAVGDSENQLTFVRSRSRFSGIDKTVIESLPFFRFSALKGLKEGLECAVCLSKFEDVEILRLVPKCKHAFHIDCIDHWLEKHSTCPICRHRVNPEDHTTFTYSNSLRMLAGEESNIEILVQREEEEHHGSSRFSVIGSSSFRKTVKEEELLIQKGAEDSDGNQKGYHKHNRRITISDVVFKHRWSNVSPSDLMFLNSEMLNDTSSNRFSSNLESITRGVVVENEQIMNIKEEMERKISFENKVVGALNNIVSDHKEDPPFTSDSAPKYVNPGEKRSMSEITAVSRFGDLGMKMRVLKDFDSLQNNLKEERMRQIWFPIARRTAQWFVNREERRSLQSQNNKQQPLDV
ncbi:E3 ubiquitin-protein ligase ATL42-like precursor [Glycine max]|uniref:RING-type E3 ubiquitin transferase n=1 Tax=Glycine max TaxID=3847 RepID=C6TGT4_SOYBN|nr:E3 ubiquitin-protein ligase ATL42-like precursor [Glycine max]ACU21036.1 unknown [Glycine max]|eukprot:NP_001304388.1 E3 ubiquitin-protein ligase ATL42-like precursor [Glycine max]